MPAGAYATPVSVRKTAIVAELRTVVSKRMPAMSSVPKSRKNLVFETASKLGCTPCTMLTGKVRLGSGGGLKAEATMAAGQRLASKPGRYQPTGMIGQSHLGRAHKGVGEL